MTTKTQFSILTPTYNCSNYILRSYESLISQTMKNWEWIIVNDGSTDDTELVLNQIVDKRVKVFNYDINRGRGYARNYALNKCNSDIVVIWDIDDIYLPTRLENIYQALNEDDYDFFASFALVLDNNYGIKGLRGFHQQDFYKSFVHPTLAFKREITKKYGYDETMRAGEDLFLMIMLSNNYKGYYMEKILMLYFEDREINLNKTIQMHKSHSESIFKLIRENHIHLSLRKKIQIRFKLQLKKYILNVLQIMPSLYLNSVSFRAIKKTEKDDIESNITSFINKYKINF